MHSNLIESQIRNSEQTSQLWRGFVSAHKGQPQVPRRYDLQYLRSHWVLQYQKRNERLIELRVRFERAKESTDHAWIPAYPEMADTSLRALARNTDERQVDQSSTPLRRRPQMDEPIARFGGVLPVISRLMAYRRVYYSIDRY
jgi:hypothetical protein